MEADGDWPWVRLADVWELFGYPSYAAARMALSRGTFPVPTYKVSYWRVVDKEVIRQFFRLRRAEDLRALADMLEEQASELEGKPPLRKQLRLLRRQIKKLKQERLEGRWVKAPWED